MAGTACDPYFFNAEAVIVHSGMLNTFLPAVGAGFGSEAQGLWADYLSRALPVPRPLRQFDTAGGQIVSGFSRHPKTGATEAVLVDLAAAALRAAPRAFPPNTPVTVPLAGGIDPAADTRNAWGDLVITNHADPAGVTTDLTIEPKLTFKVEDNVKFCPGNPGPFFIQPLTIPLSRLEATGTRHGAPFAGVVPFWVLFAGPGAVKSFGTSIPVAPPVPPTPTPRTGPARTTGTQLHVRSGPETDHPIVDKFVQRDTPITVLEQTEGTEIRGNNRRDRIEGGWVSDSYVEFNAQP